MKKLTENHFAFKCPMNWNEMAPSANGKFCGKCRKEVFDLTNCSIDEVIALQRKHGAICGSIKVVVVAASLSAAACQNSGQDIPVVKCQENQNGSVHAIAGGIMPLDYPKSMGKVALSGTPLPPDELEKLKKE